MSSYALPQELVDQVIDHLWNEPEELKACTLASHSFTHSSQLHLFEAVYLDAATLQYSDEDYVEKPSPSRFLQLLIEAPHIIPFVKTLEIGFFAITDPALPSLLKMLPNVQSLSIDGPLEDIEATDFGFRAWEDLPIEFKDALSYFITVSPLKFLSLDTINGVPTSLFRLCPGLSSLSLTEALFDDDNSFGSLVQPASRACLRELEIDTAVHCDLASFLESMTDPCSALDLTYLESFCITVDCQDNGTVDYIQQMLDVNGASLTHFGFNPDHLKQILSFSKLRTLNSLVLDFAYNVQAIHDPIPWLLETLRTFNSSTSSLTTLHLLIVLEQLECPSGASSLWTELDTLLAEDSRFKNLKQCSITIGGSFHQDAAKTALKQHLDVFLPKLTAKQIIF